jgi:hypothetical protein
MRETTHQYGGALHVIAIVLAVSILLPFLVKPPREAAAAKAWSA